MARFADAGRLAPLARLFSPAELADFLPTIHAQGTIEGQLYALGSYDSATVLWWARDQLDAAGVAYTHGGPGWSWPQLIQACERLSARGVLASAANVAALRAWQSLFLRGFALADAIDPDPFGSGKAALDCSGHWLARSHLQNKGAALGVMGLPHLGPQPVAACGSFCWALSSRTRQPELAAKVSG